MNCAEARQLIDQGVQPNAQSARSAQLGFHLAACAACRAERDQQQQTLLDAWLSADPSRRQPPLIAVPVVPQRPAIPWQRKPIWMVTLSLLVAVPVLLVAFAVGVVVRTNRNLDAMVLAPVAAVATPIPATTATPATSVTPEPAPSDGAQAAQATPSIVVSPTAWPTLQAAPSAVPSPTVVVEQPTPAPPGAPVTILLLGTDRRPGETGTPRTDAVMLARVDPQSGRIALLSLPRDLWVDIPDYGASRINAAYVWGETYAAPGGGMELARATVSNLLGIPIDYVATIDFEGFIGLIDTLDGVPVEVDKELYDPQFPTMDYGYMEAEFQLGRQTMDGSTALIYSRIRHPDSDFVRIRRQQAVLVGIGERLRERGDLENLLTLDETTGALADYVRTDMPKEQIVALVWAMRNSDVGNVQRYAVDESAVTFGVGDDQYALVPVPERLAQLVDDFVSTP